MENQSSSSERTLAYRHDLIPKRSDAEPEWGLIRDSGSASRAAASGKIRYTFGIPTAYRQNNTNFLIPLLKSLFDQISSSKTSAIVVVMVRNPPIACIALLPESTRLNGLRCEHFRLLVVWASWSLRA